MQIERFFESSPNAYVVVDRDLRVVHANRAYLKLTGSRLADLIGQPILGAFPNNPGDPNDASRRMLRESLQQVLQAGKPDHLAHIPYRVPRAPGSEPELRVWSATHTPILDGSGAVTHILQHTEDLTDLQRAAITTQNVFTRAAEVQRTRDEQVTHLRSVFEQTPGFTAFLRGPEHVFELANPGYVKLVGGRDVIGQRIRDALPELVDQGFYELLDRVYASGEPFVGRGVRVELADYIAYVDFIYQPIFGAAGKPVGILVQGQDITEQTIATQRQQFITRATELLTSSTDLEAALVHVAWAATEALADWAIVDLFDGDGEHQSSRRIAVAHADPAMAPSAAKLASWPVKLPIPEHHVFHQLRGRVLVQPFSPELIASHARSAEHATLLRELDLKSFVLVPLWHAGRLFGLFAAHSARKAFDERIVPVMTELGRLASTALANAHLTREREALLASEHAARQRAEAASRAKDDFIAVLGHELRNPLAPILSAVQLLRLRGEVGREAEVIERQTRHLVRLVDDLLDVSRIVHGKIELRRAPLELAAVVAKAVELAGPQVAEKHHELEVDAEPGLAMVGDEARLAQVVANLVTNAARYTPPRGRIAVTARRDNGHAIIRVRDNGVGIPPAMLSSIFEMFVQAPQPSDRATGGLGLGLTLVRRISELHGGTVTAVSDGPGRGTEMIVRLPIIEGPAARPTPVPAAEERARSVLIVDDNVDAAMLLGEILARRGHTTAIAHDGREALAELERRRFDAALIDIGLPEIDGNELARQIRARLGDTSPYLIALTGYGSQDDRDRSRAAGFREHVTKPVDIATLCALLARREVARPE